MIADADHDAGIDHMLANLDRHDEVVVGVSIGPKIRARVFSSGQLELDPWLARAQSVVREFDTIAAVRQWVERHAADDWRKAARRIALGKVAEDRQWALRGHAALDDCRAWLAAVGPERYVEMANAVLLLNRASVRVTVDPELPHAAIASVGLQAMMIERYTLSIEFVDERARDRFVREADIESCWAKFVRTRLQDDPWVFGRKHLGKRPWYLRINLSIWGGRIL